MIEFPYLIYLSKSLSDGEGGASEATPPLPPIEESMGRLEGWTSFPVRRSRAGNVGLTGVVHDRASSRGRTPTPARAAPIRGGQNLTPTAYTVGGGIPWQGFSEGLATFRRVGYLFARGYRHPRQENPVVTQWPLCRHVASAAICFSSACSVP